MPGNAQQAILTALYGRIGLTRVRNILDPGIQPRPDATFNFSGKLGADQVAFVKQARRSGLKVFFPAPVYLEDWMQPGDPGAYVSWAMAVLRYWRSQGVEPPYYSPLNEPEIGRDFPPQWMHDVVLRLGRRLASEGFRTKLVVPDDENPVDAHERSVAVLEDPEARKYVGALAYHIYKGTEADWPRMRELAARYRLPLWMTEFYGRDYVEWPGALDWSVKMHDLLTVGGVNAVDYLFGFFGTWARTGQMIEMNFDGDQYRSFRLTPVYFVTGQYSKYVKPGYRRIAASPESGDVLTVAFTGPGKLVVVATNPTHEAQAVRFVFTGGKIGPRVAVQQTSSGVGLQSRPSLPVRRGVLSTILPRQSVTTFVATR